jgi:two-component sensor histidine kinase
LSNALKYGIPSKHGKIMVTFSVISDQRYELRISDNGAGIPPDIDLDTLDSLGLQLVKGLVEEQLDGMLELERHQGTAWRITFPGTC